MTKKTFQWPIIEVEGLSSCYLVAPGVIEQTFAIGPDGKEYLIDETVSYGKVAVLKFNAKQEPKNETD